MKPALSARIGIPRRAVVWLCFGWLLVLLKTAFTPVVLWHWAVPVDAGWVILPTLLLAAVVTVLVFGHSWTEDER